MTTLLGDVSLAASYSTYLENSVGINALIEADPQTTFSLGWLATLARAAELGLNRRSYTDWTGGYETFLDEAIDGRVGGEKLTAAQLQMGMDPVTGLRYWSVSDGEGAFLGFVEDTIEAGSDTVIEATAADDLIDLRSGTLADQRGLTVNGKLRNDIAVSSGPEGARDFAATTQTNSSTTDLWLGTSSTRASPKGWSTARTASANRLKMAPPVQPEKPVPTRGRCIAGKPTRKKGNHKSAGTCPKVSSLGSVVHPRSQKRALPLRSQSLVGRCCWNPCARGSTDPVSPAGVRKLPKSRCTSTTIFIGRPPQKTCTRYQRLRRRTWISVWPIWSRKWEPSVPGPAKVSGRAGTSTRNSRSTIMLPDRNNRNV